MLFEVLFMIHSVNHKINLIYEYGRLKVKCSLINTWSVEGLATTQRSLIDVWSIEHDFFANKMFDRQVSYEFDVRKARRIFLLFVIFLSCMKQF